jgi:hypothetical protein
MALAHNQHLKNVLDNGYIGEEIPLDEEQKKEIIVLIQQAKDNPIILAEKVSYDLFFQEIADLAEKEGKNILEYLVPPLKKFEKFSNPFPFDDENIENIEDLPKALFSAIKLEIDRLEKAVSTGIDDQRKALDPTRKKMFLKEVEKFNQEDFPVEIPDVVTEMKCNHFGHICPVVFVGEAISETTEIRRRGRYIPFKTKIRVVRRDNYTCQECGKHLKDDEVEFDHIIPHSKGGSCEEHNLRLTCFDCNRGKSDAIEI